MLPGPTIIRRCSNCNQKMGEATILSGNTCGAECRTDGFMLAPMLPQNKWLVKCPHCESLLWLDELENVELNNFDVSVGESFSLNENDYLNKYISDKHPASLVITTGVRKSYCDELSGDIYPRVVLQLQKSLKKVFLNNANYFGTKIDKWKYKTAPKLLNKGLDKGILKIDDALHKMLKTFELLSVINPANSRSEKKKFLKNKYNVTPKFSYTPIKIDTYKLKQDLLALNLNEIGDVNIRGMYQDFIRSYFDKIDMIASLNSDNFLYNSLRYFGRPSKVDLSNASYILHLPDVPGEAKKQPVYTGVEAKDIFEKALKDYGIDAKIELSKKVISQVMVLNSKKSILIQPESKFKLRDLGALIEHEIGIHMVTTINSNEQRLKIFNLGLPHNTKTQEGMAILSEYLSGNMSLNRLKKLALRVIAVDMMADGADFIEVFDELVKEYGVDENDAYVIAVRVFRGGGFTKDHVYLSGFVRALKMWGQDIDFRPLLVGKTSVEYLHTIEEMIEREMVAAPKFLNKSFMNPQEDKNNPIYKYILSGLK